MRIVDSIVRSSRALVGATKGVVTGLSALGEVGQKLLTGIFPGKIGDPQKRGTRQTIESFKTQPWIRATVGKMASAYAAVPWQLYAATTKKGGEVKFILNETLKNAHFRERAEVYAKAVKDGDLKRIENHPALDLIHKPVPYYLTGQTARRLTFIYRYLVGESFQIVERAARVNPRTKRNVPVQLWPVPPTWVLWTPTPDSLSFKVSYRGWNSDVPLVDMLWALRDPDVENPYARGSGVGRALDDEMASDENAAKLQNYAFYNKGRPDAIVSLTGADSDEVRELDDAFKAKHQGIAKHGRTWFTNVKAEYTPLAQTFEELRLLELRRFSRDLFLQVPGIPPEILGILESSNRSTIDAADYHFSEHVIVPELEFEREFLQEFLIPDFDERLILGYESPVREDREYQRSIMAAAPYAFRVDEYRIRAGESALPNGEGQVFMKPFGVQGVESLLPTETVQQGLNGAQISAAREIVAQVAAGELPRDSGIGMLVHLYNLDPKVAEEIMGEAGTGEETKPNPIPSTATEPDAGATNLGPDGKPVEGQVPPALAGAAAAAAAAGDQVEDDDEEEPEPKKAFRLAPLPRAGKGFGGERWKQLIEDTFLPAEELFSTTYRKFVRSTAKDQVARVRQLGADADPKKMLFDVKAAKADLGKRMKPAFEKVARIASAQMLEEIEAVGSKRGVPRIRKDANTRDVFLEELVERVGYAVDTMSERIERAIIAAAQPGADVDAIIRAIEEEFDLYEEGKVDSIGQDQASATIGGSRALTLDEEGVEASEWVTAEDERVRETHVVYGNSGPHERGFNYATLTAGGAYTLRFPHDEECDELSDVLGCRCVEVPA